MFAQPSMQSLLGHLLLQQTYSASGPTSAPPELSSTWPGVRTLGHGLFQAIPQWPSGLTVTVTRPPAAMLSCLPNRFRHQGQYTGTLLPSPLRYKPVLHHQNNDLIQRRLSTHKAQVSNGRTTNRKTPFLQGLNLSGGFKPASCSTKNTQFCRALQAQRTPSKRCKQGKDNFLLSSNGETLILLQQLSHTLPHIKGSNMSTPPFEMYRQKLAKTLTNTVTSWQFRLSFFGRCVY